MESPTKSNELFRTQAAPVIASLILLGAVTAFFVYRRRRGKALPIAATAIAGIKSLANLIQNRLSLAKRTGPEKTTSTFSAAQIQTGPVDLDQLPAI